MMIPYHVLFVHGIRAVVVKVGVIECDEEMARDGDDIGGVGEGEGDVVAVGRAGCG